MNAKERKELAEAIRTAWATHRFTMSQASRCLEALGYRVLHWHLNSRTIDVICPDTGERFELGW